MSIGHRTGSAPLTRSSPSPCSLLRRAPVLAVRLSAPLYPVISATDAFAVFFTFLLLAGQFGLGLAADAAAVANGAGPASASDHQQPVESSQSSQEYFLDFLNATSSRDCPVLHARLAREICALPANWRKRTRTQMMRTLRFKFCGSFLVFHAVGPACSDIEGLSEAACVRCFDGLEKHDFAAQDMYCQFVDALSRFDCRSEYSRHWKCKHCKVSASQFIGW